MIKVNTSFFFCSSKPKSTTKQLRAIEKFSPSLSAGSNSSFHQVKRNQKKDAKKGQIKLTRI